MYPVLVEIPLGPLGHLPVNTYGMMVLVGFLGAVWIGVWRGRSAGVSAETIWDVGIWSMLAGMVGARLWYVVQFQERFDWRILEVWDGGLRLTWGILGWMIPLGWWLWRKGLRAPFSGSVGRVLLKLAGLVAVCVLFGVVAARAGYMWERVLAGGRWVRRYELYDWGLLKVWEGGIVLYGGLVAAFLASVWYLKLRRLSVLEVADVAFSALPVGTALGRVGCFLNGCCYGILSGENPLGVCFPRNVSARTGEVLGSPAYLDHQKWFGTSVVDYSLPIVPVQLFFALGETVIFVLLSWFWYRRKVSGQILGLYAILYGGMRFGLEFLRGDSQATWAGLTFSQLVSIGVLLAGLILLGILAFSGLGRVAGRAARKKGGFSLDTRGVRT